MQNFNEEFAEAVKQILRLRGWSYAKAQIYSGDSLSTSGSMSMGFVPKDIMILAKWADAVAPDRSPEGRRKSREEWFRLAGYDYVPLPPPDEPPPKQEEEGPPNRGPVRLPPDLLNLPEDAIIARYDDPDLTMAEREAVRRAAIRQMEATAQALKEARKKE